jgi:poly-gamma-glutamate synthesis protein (capsule biosynthesis protein)
MDYGAEGLTQTIKKLKDRGINFVGAGINNDEAFKETIFKIKNKSIAFLACTSNEPHVGSIIATHSSEGCASFLNIEKLIEKVKELKKTVDIICISLHWGHELYFYPTSDQVSIARLLLNEGATIIIGHHPHVIQGIEKGNNSLIIYSLGNLFLPNFKNIFGRFELHKPITREFMIIKCVISSEMAITTEIIGGIVNVDYRIIPFQIEKNSEFIKRIEYLSKPFKHKNYESFWFQYKIQRARELSRQELLDAFRKLFKMIFERKLCTISNDDIKRNLCRALNIFPPPKKY